MDDIEITQKIKNLTWNIDLEKGIIESDLVRYKIIKKKNYTDLKGVWFSPDVPTVATVINEIQRSAITAYEEALKNAR
jgi:hypothetical protein